MSKAVAPAPLSAGGPPSEPRVSHCAVRAGWWLGRQSRNSRGRRPPAAENALEKEVTAGSQQPAASGWAPDTDGQGGALRR